MKKTYETPSVEVVKFQYRDQVVAASGDGNTSTDQSGDNLFQSSEYGSCYSAGEVVEYLFTSWLGQCDFV